MIQKSSNGKFFFYGKEISESKYAEIMDIIQHKPTREGYQYILLEDLTWQEQKVELPDLDAEIDDVEAYNIIFGGGE